MIQIKYQVFLLDWHQYTDIFLEGLCNIWHIELGRMMTYSNIFYPPLSHISPWSHCYGNSASEAEGSAASSNDTKYHSHVRVKKEGRPLVTELKYISMGPWKQNQITLFLID